MEQNYLIRKKHITHLGRHILAEFFDCNSDILNDVALIEEKMTQAAIECGATIVEKCFISLIHKE